jgi:hypothetical protein
MTPSRVLWTLEEGEQDRLPGQIRSLVMLVRYPAGKLFQATVVFQATIWFSLNSLVLSRGWTGLLPGKLGNKDC